jgi:hypothetical protein
MPSYSDFFRLQTPLGQFLKDDGTWAHTDSFFDAGNSGTSKTIDWNNGRRQKVTMTGNCTFTFSNPVAGRDYTLILVQDGTGSRLATWPATVDWPSSTAPTLTTTAAKRDLVTFLWDGTDYFGVVSGQNY